MSLTDPIADMLTRVRNGLAAGHLNVSMPSSKLKVAIAQILQSEGFVEAFEVVKPDDGPQPVLRIQMKYVGLRRKRRPVITGIERVSRPGRRVYVGKAEIPWVRSGVGVAILTTPKGVMTGLKAREMGIGGEVLCKVW
jgi:small subunit ribosomal protein S8